jgi:putative transposase
VANFIETMFGSHYSPTTASNTFSTVLEDMEQWHKRPQEVGMPSFTWMG